MSVLKMKIHCMLMLHVVSNKVRQLANYYLYYVLMTSVTFIALFGLSCLQMAQLLLVHTIILTYCTVKQI